MNPVNKPVVIVSSTKSALGTAAESKAISAFSDLVQQGIDAWTEAGEILVKLVDVDPLVLSRIRTACPHISKDMLRTFECIGRKQIYAPLLSDNSLGAQKLLMLPFEEQKKYYHEPIDIVISSPGSAKPIIKKRLLCDIERCDINKVFSDGRILSADEQRKRQISGDGIKRPAKAATPIQIPKFVDYKIEDLGTFEISINSSGVPSITTVPKTTSATPLKLTPNGTLKSHIVSLYRHAPR